jgi:hypothetical protein
MGGYSGLYFDNIQVDCEEDATPSVCRILFRPADFLQVPRFGSCRPICVPTVRGYMLWTPTRRCTVFSAAQQQRPSAGSVY